MLYPELIHSAQEIRKEGFRNRRSIALFIVTHPHLAHFVRLDEDVVIDTFTVGHAQCGNERTNRDDERTTTPSPKPHYHLLQSILNMTAPYTVKTT